MTESTYIPHGKLSPYVKFIWYCDGYEPPARKERVLPEGTSRLILNLGAERFRHYEGSDHNQIQEYSHTLIAGVHSGVIFLDAYTRISTMGIVFRPGGIQALFTLPADEFRDQVVSLEDIVDSDITALREKLIEASIPRKKFTILESFLSGLLNTDFRPNPAVIFAVGRIHDYNGVQPISKIAKQIGYSRRRFSDLFSGLAGIAPKEYARIRRFQYVLRVLRGKTEPNWSRIALECGYYDQAHFNRDFRALSGLTPTEYFRNKTGEINHLPV